MSDRNSSRRASREALLKMLFQMEVQGDFSEKARKNFSEEFLGEKLDREYFDSVFDAYITHNDEIDDLIEKYSRGWKVERLAKPARIATSVMEIFGSSRSVSAARVRRRLIYWI